MKEQKVGLHLSNTQIKEQVCALIEANFTLVDEKEPCDIFLTDNHKNINQSAINILISDVGNIAQYKGVEDIEGFDHYIVFNDIDFLQERVKKAIMRHYNIKQHLGTKNDCTGVNAIINMDPVTLQNGNSLPIIKRFCIKNSKERSMYAEELEKFILDLETIVGYKNPVKAQYAVEIQEELLMNAIWDANPKYASSPRTTQIELNSGEEIFLEWAFNGKELGISVRDPFGRLNPDIMQKYVNFIFKTGKQNEHKLSEQKISAGLGMYMIIQRANLLSVFISKGKVTDVGVVIIGGEARRTKTSIPKAIDIFSKN